MPIYQFTGLSGAGKSTLANAVKPLLEVAGRRVELIDGDVYRQVLCKDLGFSKADRQENIRRLAFVANLLSQHGVVVIIAAINPYEEIRQEIKKQYGAEIVWINCGLETLKERDPKGLYRKAFLPDDHPEKLFNLTGVSDTFDVPEHPDLIINTEKQTIDEAVQQLADFILSRP